MATCSDHHELPAARASAVGHRSSFTGCRERRFPQFIAALDIERSDITMPRITHRTASGMQISAVVFRESGAKRRVAPGP